MNSVGSTWGLWDLHIHTPASFHWKGKQLAEQSSAERLATWAAIVDRFNAVPMVAFGIMDYWTFDGYLGLREYLRANSTATNKTVLPGIEIRLEAPTDYRLNT